jgi:hypothetical protein
VSNAKEDLPEPDKPVMTVNDPRGMVTSIFFRLLTLTPLASINFCSLIASCTFLSEKIIYKYTDFSCYIKVTLIKENSNFFISEINSFYI